MRLVRGGDPASNTFREGIGMDKLSVWKRKIAKEERKRRVRAEAFAQLVKYLDRSYLK